MEADKIDTHIPGDPEACREVGKQVKAQADRFGDAGAALRKVQGQAAETWLGKAGDAFYDHLQKWLPVGPSMESTMMHVGGAFLRFGDDTQTAQKTIQQAIQAARQGGLHYDGRYIYAPEQSCPQEPPEGSPKEEVDKFKAAEVDRQKKIKAWNEVCQTNATAKGQQAAAESNFEQALSKSHWEMEGFAKSVGTAISRVVSFAGPVNGTTKAFAATGKMQRGFIAAALSKIAKHPKTMSASMLGQVVQQMKLQAWDKYQKIYPKGLKKAAAFSVEDLEALPAGVRKMPFVRKLGPLGTVLAAGNAGTNVHYGADPAKEWTKFGVGTAEGLAITEGVGAAIPGPGWAYVAGSAVAIPVTWASDHFIDHWGDGTDWDLKHEWKRAGEIEQDNTSKGGMDHVSIPY